MSGTNDVAEDEDEGPGSDLNVCLVDFNHLPQIRHNDQRLTEKIFADESGDSGQISPVVCSDDAFPKIVNETYANSKPDKCFSVCYESKSTSLLEASGYQKVELRDTTWLDSLSDCSSDCKRGENEKLAVETAVAEQKLKIESTADFINVSSSPKITYSQSHDDDVVMSLKTEDSSSDSVRLVAVKQILTNGEDQNLLCSSDLSEPLTNSRMNESAAASNSSPASLSNFFESDEDSEPFGSYVVNPEGDDGRSRGASQGNEETAASVERQRIRRKRLYRFSSSSSEEDLDTSLSSSMSSGKSSSRSSSFAVSKACKLDAAADSVTKDMWRQTKEIFNRQLGHGTTTGPDVNFQRCVGGSLNLVQKLQLYTKYERHKGCVNALNFNETGTLIASGSDDLQIVIWDWVLRKSFIEFDSGHRANVFQSKFMPYTGDCHIVSCARDGQVRLAQLSVTGTCKGTKKLAQHKGAAHKLAILPDSCHVFLSCGEDGVTYQIDLRQEKPIRLYMTKENSKYVALYSIHANPFNSYEHCVGGRDQFIRIYDTRKTENGDGAAVVKKFCPHQLVDADVKSHVTCAVYNYNGTAVLGTYNDDDIYLFDNSHSDGADYTHKYSGHRNSATVKGVNFYGPKSEFVVSGSDCGNVFLWDAKSEAVVNFFHADANGVINVLEPHPHIPLMATSGLDNDVKLWMPAAERPAEMMQDLSKLMRKNRKDRERELNEPELIDSEMLWFLMHRLRRSAAQFQEDGEDGSSSDDSAEENSISDDVDDDNQPVQCSQS